MRSDVTKSINCNPAARIFLTLLALQSMQSVTALGQIDESKFREDLKVLAAQPRITGSIGYTQAADYIQREILRIQDASGQVELRRHEFPVMVPETRGALLYLSTDPQNGQPVYPFWPAHIRLNATPALGITGKPIYVG